MDISLLKVSKRLLRCSFFAIVATLGNAHRAVAIPFSLAITADNAFALFTGTGNRADQLIGASRNRTETQYYTADVLANRFLYVAAESDLVAAQGLAGQLTQLATGDRFCRQDAQWQVSATGRYGLAPSSGSGSHFAMSTQQILTANGVLTPTANTPAATFDATSWLSREGIDGAARWLSHDKKRDGSDPGQGGINADEHLVFRIAVNATPVPEPSSFLLVAIGFLGLCMARRRQR